MDLTLKKFLSSTNFTRYRAFRNQYNFFFFFLRKLLLLNLFIEQNCALSRKILCNRLYHSLKNFPIPIFRSNLLECILNFFFFFFFLRIKANERVSLLVGNRDYISGLGT